MKKRTILIIAIGLCLLTAPVMAHEEDEGGGGTLYGSDNIWIAISPIEEHPMNTDRPFAIIPDIPGYPIRVAVYSNPYYYTTFDEDGNAIVEEVNDTSAMNFDVRDLRGYSPDKITLRLPEDPEGDILIPASDGAEYKKLHTESDYKWQYVFYVRDMDTLASNIDRLFFCVEDDDGNIKYRGSGAVMVTATSKSGGGGGGPPANRGGGRDKDNSGEDDIHKKPDANTGRRGGR